jgi:hypothetical protein
MFWYSGDPVQDIGWINTTAVDQRQMQNLGPFKLVRGEEQEVFIAYSVGQGGDAITSITEAKNVSDFTHVLYDINFDPFLLSIEDKTINMVPNEFTLGQNYPNPFNPSTTIKFSLPSSGYVTLKIYNDLGEEVAVLLDKELTNGTYEVEWNANGLPSRQGSALTSGVYFYQLRTDGFVETKKMILLR